MEEKERAESQERREWMKQRVESGIDIRKLSWRMNVGKESEKYMIKSKRRGEKVKYL